MKTKNLLLTATLLTLSLSTTAKQYKSGYSYGVSHTIVKQDLFGTISFPQHAVEIRSDYLHSSGLGVRLSLARSTETANSLFVEGKFYTNKILSKLHGSIFYRLNLGDNWSIEPFVGKASYNTKWTVNGKEPAWSKGSDTDYTKGLLINYHFRPDLYGYLGYADLYNKVKLDGRKEKTVSYQLGLALRF